LPPLADVVPPVDRRDVAGVTEEDITVATFNEWGEMSRVE